MELPELPARKEISEDQWVAARKDSEDLERKIDALVDEFENKHVPIQCTVITRHREYKDKYIFSKGGAAQIKLHDRSVGCNPKPFLTISVLPLTPIRELVYVEGAPGMDD